MSELSIRLRPVTHNDLPLLRRFVTDPGLMGLNWNGFRNPEAFVGRFASDGFLGPDDGRLMVEVDGGPAAAGSVSWSAKQFSMAGRCWELGIVVLPEWRGQGIGSRVQEMVCEYLFAHTPVERIQALTQIDNLGEQKALEKAGFEREGVLRRAEFRDGAWRDLVVYARLR